MKTPFQNDFPARRRSLTTALWVILLLTSLFLTPFAEARPSLGQQTTENPHFTQAKLELTLGSFTKAHRTILKAIESDKQHYGLKHEKTAANLTLLATILLSLGQHTNARVIFLQSQTIAKHLSNDSSVIFANNLFGLANIDTLEGRYNKALASHKKILNERQAANNPSKLDIIRSLLAISELQIILAQYDKAQFVLSQTERLITHINDPAIYAHLLNQKGLLAVALKNYAAATIFYKQALDIQLTTFADNNALVANTLVNIADRLSTIGNHKLAIPLYQEATAIYAVELSEDNLKLASTMSNMAAAYLKTGENETAMQLNKKAYDMAKIIVNDNHPFFASYLINKANGLIAKKQDDTAHRLFEKAKDILETTYGNKHPKVTNITSILK